jgi:hypothetical protein
VTDGEQHQQTDASLTVLFDQFQQRYEEESSDVRSLSCEMQELLQTSNALLAELDGRPLWKRAWQFFVGHTAQVQRRSTRTQMQLMQTNTLLITAVARQNRMVMEGLRLTLEKLHRVENDARYLRETVMRVEARREARRRRWLPLTSRVHRAVGWTRQTVTRLFAPSTRSQ